MFKSRKATLGHSVESFESIVGASLRIEGDLIISKSVRIDGTVNGNILQADGGSTTVAIALGAKVHGDITVQDVIVSGYVKGNIVSAGRVELVESAKVEGNVTYGSIGIAVGAHIMGQLKQIEQMAQTDAIDAIARAANAPKRANVSANNSATPDKA